MRAFFARRRGVHVAALSRLAVGPAPMRAAPASCACGRCTRRLKLDERVQDEKDNDIHTLKAQKLDNFIYVSYGERRGGLALFVLACRKCCARAEWPCVTVLPPPFEPRAGEWSTLHGLHKHLTSGHFERFSE